MCSWASALSSVPAPVPTVLSVSSETFMRKRYYLPAQLCQGPMSQEPLRGVDGNAVARRDVVGP